MKKPKLTARESVMLVFLVVLLIGAIYYMGFLTPLKNEVAALKTETENVEAQITAHQDKLSQMNAMQAELKKYEDMSEDQLIQTPPYDNISEILADLDAYLRENSTKYNVTHTDPEPSDEGTYRRLITMNATCANLDSAYQIIDDLYSGEWRCVISDVFVSTYATNLNEGDSVNLSLSLVFYEVKPTNVKPAQPEAPAA